MNRVKISIFQGVGRGHYISCPTCDKYLTDTHDIKFERNLGKFCKHCGTELNYDNAYNFVKLSVEEMKEHYKNGGKGTVE
jgi:transposase-like protein